MEAALEDASAFVSFLEKVGACSQLSVVVSRDLPLSVTESDSLIRLCEKVTLAGGSLSDASRKCVLTFEPGPSNQTLLGKGPSMTVQFERPPSNSNGVRLAAAAFAASLLVLLLLCILSQRCNPPVRPFGLRRRYHLEVASSNSW